MSSIEKAQKEDLCLRFLPFKLIPECLLEILAREATSSYVLVGKIKETLHSTKRFIQLGLNLILLLERESFSS